MGKSISKYEIIKQEICEKIASMEYKPNQVLPSESELCEKYQVSRITVRRAVDDLVKENMVYRIKGKGCFVRENSAEGLSRIYSFTEAIIHQGKTPGREQICFSIEKADAELAARLELKEGDEVYRLKCLYLAEQERYCVSTAVLPAAMFPKLESFNFNVCSLYDVLKTFYKLNISRVKQNIFATTVDEDVRQILEIEKEKPLLKIQATSYCLYENQEKPFEVYESYILTDILSYTIEKYNI